MSYKGVCRKAPATPGLLNIGTHRLVGFFFLLLEKLLEN